MTGEWVSQGDVDPAVRRYLEVLWGKSAGRAGGRTNLLLSHLLDTAAVAELIWDHYLAVSVRRALDQIAGGAGRGKRLFAWLCGVHDFGKAVPAFQFIDDAGATAVERAGLPMRRNILKRIRWPHGEAGGMLIMPLLARAGWSGDQIDWVWPLIAGHHGIFPDLGGAAESSKGRPYLSGKGTEWDRARQGLLDTFTRAVGFADLAEVEPERVPSRAVQVQISGFMVMADWIASDSTYFKGLDSLSDISIANARERAQKAWSALGIRGGWDQLAEPDVQSFRIRFGEDPRESQTLLLDVVARMGGPGLIVVEAPMGEGKTKAALLVAEMLAARFGMDGVFVGMPTQATSDPMFSNVRKWLQALEPGLERQVALLHGKRRFNKEWRRATEPTKDSQDDRFSSIEEDDYGLDDPYVQANDRNAQQVTAERLAPAEWFLGNKRGLLSPFVVGTIDQLLFAATRTKHVMLRMAGLAGKVVILDEVHAADVYMSQFLAEGLRWLGQAGIPVVLLSATLPAPQRSELLAAYVAGTRSREEVDISAVPAPDGYPSVTAVWDAPSKIESIVEDCPAWKPDVPVTIELLAEAPSTRGLDAEGIAPRDQALVDLLQDRLAGGGCALVIRNTVDRAQKSFEALRATFGEDARLLHGRLHAADRADRTEECLRLLGPPDPNSDDPPIRPARLILVATALAEQSFDVDADLLVSDLAPIDLLLQRIGRTHRHSNQRPRAVREPHAIITGFEPRDGAPWIVPESIGIYGRYLLLRTAALVADTETWSIPRDVPSLVAKVYEPDQYSVPPSWTPVERQAFEEWVNEEGGRAASAAPFLLARLGEHDRPTLEGLHRGSSKEGLDEEQHRAMVRDGEPSIEVVLVRHAGKGYQAFSGRSLGIDGEASRTALDDILGGTVRLPSKLTGAAEEKLGPLSAWRDDPWLRYSRALILDEAGEAQLGDYLVMYHDDLGLVVKRR